MEWSKAKSLLILLMLAVNLYLGINIYTQVHDEISQEKEMILDACAILRQRDIEIDEGLLLSLPSVLQSRTWVRDPAAEQHAAMRLLGECSEERPGGGIYVYTGQGGSVIFRSGGYVEVQPAEVGGAPDLSAFLRPLDEEGSLTMHEAEGGYVLRLDGCDITGAQVLRGEGTAWSGTWIFAAEARPGDRSLPLAKLILTAGHLLESRGIHEVTDVRCVYTLTALQSGDIRLVPALYFEGEGGVLGLNAITGAELAS